MAEISPFLKNNDITVAGISLSVTADHEYKNPKHHCSRRETVITQKYEDLGINPPLEFRQLILSGTQVTTLNTKNQNSKIAIN